MMFICWILAAAGISFKANRGLGGGVVVVMVVGRSNPRKGSKLVPGKKVGEEIYCSG